ncbi:hypothetical protein QQ045_033084 [Rhodiola kirilowii]
MATRIRSRHTEGDLRKLIAMRARKSSVEFRPQESGHDKYSSRPQVKPAMKYSQDRVCKFWMNDRCVYGERCRFKHSCVLGESVTRIAQLRGHKKGVSGIAFSSCSDKLFTGSSDGMLRVWDSNTGNCDDKDVFNMGAEVGCLISEGPWVLIGVLNAIWAWNIETSLTFNLAGPIGQVHAMAVANDTIFAACQDGDILVYKPCPETNTFKLAAKLSGHTKAAVSLIVRGTRVYSGSADNTIRIWDIDTLQCIETLSGHSGAVTSILCWDAHLLSGSLDGTIKVWAFNEGGKIEEVYSYNEQGSVLALNGIIRGTDGKNILLVSCQDSSVHLYELPTFRSCGKFFTKHDVRSIQVAAERGLIFTGDGSGNVDVWKLVEQATSIEE